jgi:hypothetical protein
MVTLDHPTRAPRARALAPLALATCATLLLALSPRAARAEGDEATVAIPVPGAPATTAAPLAGASRPHADARVHHAPPTRATAHETLRIPAEIEDPHLAKQVLLVYRTGDGAFKEVPFLLAKDRWLAEIPAEDVRAPNLGYTIEIVRGDDSRAAAFASRDAPFVVDVPEDLDDLREQAWLARLHGKRSETSVSADFVWFGDTTRTTTVVAPGSGTPTTKDEQVTDRYFRTDASYTYRPLRSVIEFGVRLGIVRGTSPVANTPDTSVGLNYGAASVTFAIVDGLALTVDGLTSVTEKGFSGGGGAAIHIGDFFGEKLIVGFESVKTFGTRGYIRLDLAHRDVWRISPIVEVTDMPHADRAGLRLLIEGATRIGGGFGVVARIGYQARDFHAGGIGGGLALSYAF